MEISYKKSPRRWTYWWIAVKHFTHPQHVYNLAHGLYALPHERGIIKDLVKRGILVNEDG